MLCTYTYQFRYRGQKVYGGYQCDLVDFKKWFKFERRSLRSCIVKIDKGDIVECWIWTLDMYRLAMMKNPRGGHRGWQRALRYKKDKEELQI